MQAGQFNAIYKLKLRANLIMLYNVAINSDMMSQNYSNNVTNISLKFSYQPNFVKSAAEIFYKFG